MCVRVRVQLCNLVRCQAGPLYFFSTVARRWRRPAARGWAPRGLTHPTDWGRSRGVGSGFAFGVVPLVPRPR